MLGKLIKYELKACGRTFFPLYCAIIFMSLIVGFSMNMEVFQIQGISMIVLFGLFVALVVLTIMITIQRFRKNLLDDEGYLMFTLPVSSRELVLSKYIVSLLYAILSGIVSILSFTIMGFIISKISILELISVLSEVFSQIHPISNMILVTLLFMIVSYSVFILTLYLSVSMGQLPIFNKHRNLVAFISFFVINILSSKIYELISSIFINTIDETRLDIPINSSNDFMINLSEMSKVFSSYFIYDIVIYILLGIIILFGITYILDKKLNLE
ncbi:MULTISPECIES: ABC transporter permease [unclassified Romboutsia]|uniref:ABC transporter permease n=1 Tax=unclassified Romboutsia TaxID=2626894 RepID=UPI0008220203|nr:MULTISPECIES: ABC transporter permease [unclassified Romboutsia]SCI26317.1 ABC-2 family transporter protein [uncultured Clostridium sp.]